MARSIEYPTFKRQENGVISITGIVPPDSILELIRGNHNAFKRPEVHLQAIQRGWQLQSQLLEKGGRVYLGGKDVHINGEKHYSNRFEGKVIRPNVRDSLGYGFSRATNTNPPYPIFFEIKDGQPILFEPTVRWLEGILGHEYVMRKVGRPRFSSVSLTNQNLIHIANKYGYGRIK